MIIHVPYKVHTIHHTIMKHIHHQDKGGDDKYEVIGYTVGKPIDLGHHFGDGGGGGGGGGGHHELYHHHDFGGGNELGHGHDWAPSYGSHDFGGGGGGGDHLEGHAETAPSHEFAGHGGYGGYD